VFKVHKVLQTKTNTKRHFNSAEISKSSKIGSRPTAFAFRALLYLNLQDIVNV